MHQTSSNNLKAVDNDALSAVISQYEDGVIALTQGYCLNTRNNSMGLSLLLHEKNYKPVTWLLIGD